MLYANPLENHIDEEFNLKENGKEEAESGNSAVV